jgi:hypothetical protein
LEIYKQLPPEAVQIALVLFLSFLIGLEREERKTNGGLYSFGGVRTFPLIGLIGYSAAMISGPQMLPLAIGFMIVAGFLLLSYWHKISSSETAGVTTEMSGLATFLVGALICYGHLWIATTLGVASLLLLDLKAALEKLAARIAPDEILTFSKFLFLSAVILPILPNQEFGPFHINPLGRRLLLHGDDGGDGAARQARVAPASLLRWHPHRLRCDVPAAGDFAGALQPPTDASALYSLSQRGGAGGWGRLAVVAARG